jgi:ligand-binding sensor domain-containing protein
MEEDELLQMANTPTPYENRQQQNEKSNPKESLLAELLRDHGASPIQVTLNDLGILRAHNPSNEREKTTTWWAITSTSSISYEKPHFKITCVLTNRPKLCTTTLTLDVGNHGDLWWGKSSRIVHRLKELQDLQDELKIIWSPDDFQVVLEEARRRISLF